MSMTADRSASRARDLLDRQVLAFLDEMASTCAERDKTCEPISRSDLAAPAARKLLAASIPRQFGGAGLTFSEWGLVLEEMGRVCEDGSLGLLVSMFPAVASAIFESQDDRLINRYAVGILTGSTLVSFAYTERTDAFDFQTRYQEDGDHLIVSGEKLMMTGGSIADAFMTYVATEDGNDLSVVLIDARDAGVEIEPLWTMGLRSCGFAKLKINEARIPVERILVKAGGGLSHAQRFLNPRRVLLSAWTVGRLARTINLCADHANRTVRYGKPLASYGSVQSAFGEMRIAYESARALVHESLRQLTAAQRGEGDGEDDHTSVAKFHCVQAGMLITQTAFALMGGVAYCHPNPIERYVRDGLGSISGAGAQDIVKLNNGLRTLCGAL